MINEIKGIKINYPISSKGMSTFIKSRNNIFSNKHIFLSSYSNNNINIGNKIKSLSSRKNYNKTEYNLKYKKIIMNLRNCEDNINDMETMKQTIGVNTSKNKYRIDNSIINSKKINNNINSISSLFKKYFVKFNSNDKLIDNDIDKIKELKRNLKSYSYLSNRINENILYKKDNNINNVLKNNKHSLLTYNFNKDVYSNEQRYLVNFSNNNLINYKLKKIKNKKIKYKSKNKINEINNLKTMIYPNFNIKNIINKNKKINTFGKKKLFLRNNNAKSSYDIKKSNSYKVNNNNININSIISFKNIDIGKDIKINKKKSLNIIENPNFIINYIYQQIDEFNEQKLLLSKNRKKCLRLKLENFKKDLKQTEQDAFYQLINLKYERPMGKEINIKSNLFCSK